MKTTIKKDAKKVLDCIASTGSHHVYTFGNGGSASIANHMAVDWSKNSNWGWEVTSLCANSAMLLMITNDYGFKETCARQLLPVHSFSVLVLISSSGNSENIVLAARRAKEVGIKVIGFTGFDGGKLKKLSDVSVHINSKDYEEAEDYHHMVMHQVSRLLRGDK